MFLLSTGAVTAVEWIGLDQLSWMAVLVVCKPHPNMYMLYEPALGFTGVKLSVLLYVTESLSVCVVCVYVQCVCVMVWTCL